MERSWENIPNAKFSICAQRNSSQSYSLDGAGTDGLDFFFPAGLQLKMGILRHSGRQHSQLDLLPIRAAPLLWFNMWEAQSLACDEETDLFESTQKAVKRTFIMNCMRISMGRLCQVCQGNPSSVNWVLGDRLSPPRLLVTPSNHSLQYHRLSTALPCIWMEYNLCPQSDSLKLLYTTFVNSVIPEGVV